MKVFLIALLPYCLMSPSAYYSLIPSETAIKFVCGIFICSQIRSYTYKYLVYTDMCVQVFISLFVCVDVWYVDLAQPIWPKWEMYICNEILLNYCWLWILLQDLVWRYSSDLRMSLHEYKFVRNLCFSMEPGSLLHTTTTGIIYYRIYYRISPFV